jgi:hypothetical protein
MTYVSDVSAAVGDVATSVATGDLTKVPEQIAELKRVLHTNADTLGNEQFQNLHLTSAAFGALPAGSTLGHEHALAHAVVSETIVGVARDLVAFGQGVETFARGVDAADEGSAADLRQRQAAVDALTASVASSEGDRRNAVARGEYLTGEGDR